jgi:hypothetical protein
MRAKAALTGKTDAELLNLPMDNDENVSMQLGFLCGLERLGSSGALRISLLHVYSTEYK